MKNVIDKFFMNKTTARYGLQVKSYNEWHLDLDRALNTLPETELCTHELFHLLMQHPSSARKRTILVTEKNEPVALIGLRKNDNKWGLITNWIIPGALFPIKEGYLQRVLSAVPQEIFIAWWRQKSKPPGIKNMHQPQVECTYQILCSEDFELYWKKSGHLNTVKRARRKCTDFEFEINPSGGWEWVIRNWGKHWDILPAETEDRIIAANYLEKNGHHYTFCLKSGNELISGHTFLCHDNDFVWQVTYRNQKYDEYGVGTRLMDLAFQWAAKENHFHKIDLGGGHDNKERWAPINGEKHQFMIRPDHFLLKNSIVNFLSKVKHKLR
jgi:hypothetical protein